MKNIISPIPKKLIKAELTPDKLLRKTNKANNELYVFNSHNAPNTMREVGRLREEAYRFNGGSTGEEVDIDIYDTEDNCYEQLIVWNPEKEEILGGYRYKYGKEVKLDKTGQPHISSSHLFQYSDFFIDDFLPETIELGRSFVTLGYQSSKAGAKALFALDNLWDGLGALILRYPTMKYFFGKVTIYRNFDDDARNMILYFLNKHFPDPERLVIPKRPLRTHMDLVALNKIFQGTNFKDNYKKLNKNIRNLKQNIPPLVNAYMNLSPTMRVFGSAENDELGGVAETGIMINVHDIFKEKIARHIISDENSKKSKLFDDYRID